MFDIAQFYKLRHEKQTYDSIITRSSMIRPYQRSGKVWFWVEPTQWNICWVFRLVGRCGFAFETWQLHLINFVEWNMRKTFVFVLNVWRVNKCIWNVQINVHYSQSMYWLVENSTMFFLIKGLLFWVHHWVVLITWRYPRASISSYTDIWVIAVNEIISNFGNNLAKIQFEKFMRTRICWSRSFDLKNARIYP